MRKRDRWSVRRNCGADRTDDRYDSLFLAGRPVAAARAVATGAWPAGRTVRYRDVQAMLRGGAVAARASGSQIAPPVRCRDLGRVWYFQPMSHCTRMLA